MSQLLQQNRYQSYVAADGVTPPAFVKNGIPYAASGAFAVTTTSAIDHYHQGLPFSAEGRLCIETISPPVRVGNGATPFTASGKVAVAVNAVPNEYVNPELAGGSVNIPATAHTLVFNSNGCDYTAIPATAPQAFEFFSNTQNISGRSVQAYALEVNNPALQIGGRYRIQYTAQSLNNESYTAAIAVSGATGITILGSQRRVDSSGVEAVIFYEFEVDSVPYSASFRVGCGTTSNNTVQMVVRTPVFAQTNAPATTAAAHNGGVPYSDDGRVLLSGLLP